MKKHFKLTGITIKFNTPKINKKKVLTEGKILRCLGHHKGLPFSVYLCAATESPTLTSTPSASVRIYRFGSGTSFTNVPDVMEDSG